MKLVSTMVLLALVFCAVSCTTSSRPVREPVVQKDATIIPDREDSEQIERTERKHTDPWKH